MMNTIIEFKDSVIKKFGPVLGYAILIIGGLLALSILGFLLKTLFSVVIWLIIAGLIIFGVYRLSEWLKTKKHCSK